MKILTIAKFTFRDIYKSRILYLTLWMALFVLVASYITSEFSYGNPLRVSIDFGLGCASLASNLLAIFVGVNILSSEIESRTIYIVLSRPVSRAQFLIGKILGVTLMLILSSTIIFGLSIMSFLVRGGELSNFIFNAFALGVLESILLFLIVLLFSLFSSKAFSVINTVVLYFVGHAISHVGELSFVKNRAGLEYVISLYKKLLPDLSMLNLRPYVFNTEMISNVDITKSYIYGISYILVLCVLNSLVFKNKELS